MKGLGGGRGSAGPEAGPAGAMCHLMMCLLVGKPEHAQDQGKTQPVGPGGWTVWRRCAYKFLRGGRTLDLTPAGSPSAETPYKGLNKLQRDVQAEVWQRSAEAGRGRGLGRWVGGVSVCDGWKRREISGNLNARRRSSRVMKEVHSRNSSKVA